MLLLPFWHSLFTASQKYGGFRFLLVVRDGRDIAFSSNQSPVLKFYNNSYGPGYWQATAPRSEQERAMELWNDWNVQTLDWAEQFSDDPRFEFHVFHAEDLVRGSSRDRLKAVMDLHAFVGSDTPIVSICCKLGLEDQLIRRGTTGRNYGKWKGNSNTKLIEAIHSLGFDGLEALGYDPEPNWHANLPPIAEPPCPFDIDLGYIFDRRRTFCSA